jgi:transcriptional/translational regulatory protein YebC/TACO1
VEDIGTEDQDDNSLQIFCSPNSVVQIQKSLAAQGFEIAQWGSGFVPNELIDIPEQEQDKVSQFLENMENQDEVVHVYHNAK